MTRTNKIRMAALASIAALALAAAGGVQAAGPEGFAAPAAATAADRAPQGFGHDESADARAPQGFGSQKFVTVDWVFKNGADDQVVRLRGRFTAHLKGDKYEFEDEKGDAITAELDHDRDWSMVRRGELMEIRAEVDRDWNRTKLDVRSARPVPAGKPAGK